MHNEPAPAPAPPPLLLVRRRLDDGYVGPVCGNASAATIRTHVGAFELAKASCIPAYELAAVAEVAVDVIAGAGDVTVCSNCEDYV